MLNEGFAVTIEPMEPYIFVFATVIITANAVPKEQTHVQVDVGKPYHRAYPGIRIRQIDELLSDAWTTGDQCVAACEKSTQCRSVDYNWLIGYCLLFRTGFSDRRVKTVSDLDAIHVEVKPPMPDAEGGNNSVHVSGNGPIAAWHCTFHVGYAYGNPFDQHHGRKIATKEINVRTGADCVRHCLNSNGCRAVNYRWMNGKCTLLTSGKEQDQKEGVFGQLADTYRADYVHIELWNPL